MHRDELKKMYPYSEFALIEFISLVWTSKCGHDYSEEVYAELIEYTKFIQEAQDFAKKHLNK
jgi:hypothetical protein